MIKKFLNKKKLLLLVSFFYLFTNVNVYGMDQNQEEEKEQINNSQDQNNQENKIKDNKIVTNENRNALIQLLKKTLNDKKTDFNNILPKIKKEQDKDNKFEFEEIDNNIKNNFNAKVKLYFKKIEKNELIAEINKFKGNNINEENKEKIETKIESLSENAEKLLGTMFISVNSQGVDLKKNKTTLDKKTKRRINLLEAVKKEAYNRDIDFDKNIKISERKKNLKRIEILNKTIEKIITKLTPEIFFDFLNSKEYKSYLEIYKKFLITDIKENVSDFNIAIEFINSKIGEFSSKNQILKNQFEKIKNNLTHYNKITNNYSNNITKDNIDDRTMRDFLLNNDVILVDKNKKYKKYSSFDSYYDNIAEDDIFSTIHKDVNLKDNKDFEKIYLDVSKLKNDLVEFLRNLKIDKDIDAIYKDNSEKVIQDFQALAEITLKKDFENKKEEMKEKIQNDINNIPDNDKKNDEIKKLKETEEKNIKEITEKYNTNLEDISKKIQEIMKENKVDVKADKNELTKTLNLSSLNDIDVHIFKSFTKIDEILTVLKKPINHYLIYTSKVKSMNIESKKASAAAAPVKSIGGGGSRGGAKHSVRKGAPVKRGGITKGRKGNRSSNKGKRKQTKKKVKKNK